MKKLSTFLSHTDTEQCQKLQSQLSLSSVKKLKQSDKPIVVSYQSKSDEMVSRLMEPDPESTTPPAFTSLQLSTGTVVQ